MLKLFCPDLYIENIYNLDLDSMKKKNIKGILIDLDNTLIPWDSTHIEERLRNWVSYCKKQGFIFCIVSNNKYNRTKHCAKRLGIPAIARSFKPCKRAFKKGMAILRTQPEQTAVIGDQIFTDILGAKRLGLFAILVKPLSKRELRWTKIMRKFEHMILKVLKDKKFISID